VGMVVWDTKRTLVQYHLLNGLSVRSTGGEERGSEVTSTDLSQSSVIVRCKFVQFWPQICISIFRLCNRDTKSQDILHKLGIIHAHAETVLVKMKQHTHCCPS